MKKWFIVIAVIALGGAAWYLFSVREGPVEETAPPPPRVAEPAPSPVAEPAAQQPAPVSPAAPAEPVVEQPVLPPLEESDALAIETLSGLAGAAAVQQWMVQEDVVPRLVATVDSLSGRQVPASVKAVEGPGGEFQATADEDPASAVLDEAGDPIPQYVLDPANYQRYTAYVDTLESVSTEALATAYRDYRPLFEKAFAQLGYPEGDFDQRLNAIIDELLATPEVAEPVRLVKPEAYYLLADEELEALTAGQKVLIRMGPDNAARVKAKLAEIRDAL